METMTGQKQKIAVLFGGMSSEHEISLRSVTFVLAHMPETEYEIYRIGITKQGKWLLYSGDNAALASGDWERDPENRPVLISPDRGQKGLILFEEDQFRRIELDAVFPVLHGRNGEDGTIQGLLAMSGIPYVGCDTFSSAVCMDKAVTHTLLSAANIEQTHYLWFYYERYQTAAEAIRTKIEARLNFPLFVKPSNAGSSIGVSKVEGPEQLDAAIKKAAKEDRKILIEEGIAGQEVECAVLGNHDANASVIGEIGASAEFYDYDDKYINGTSQQLIPANIKPEVAERIREISVRAFRLLGCRGLARIDFFVTEDDRILLNEINTMPGFTSISMYPMLWAHMGMDAAELVRALLDHALKQGHAAEADNG